VAAAAGAAVGGRVPRRAQAAVRDRLPLLHDGPDDRGAAPRHRLVTRSGRAEHRPTLELLGIA
jgi:hypothetical protein